MTSSAIVPYPIEPIAARPTDAKLEAAFLNSLSDYGARLHGRRIWLACSGGRDSLALAALCVQLYRQGKLPFLPQLLHVDHRLQADSHHWSMHVAQWAQKQQLPCHILQAQVNGHDEQAARQARYDVMRVHMNQDDVLLLAHHADDQAETVLMRLIQGAGVNGLSGIQPWRVQTQGAHRIILWRPWLTVQRADISAYATRLQLPYIDDPTNETGDNVRSGLRRDIMPILAEYNPNVIDNIARSAQLLSDAEATVRAQAIQDVEQTAIGSLQLSSAQRVLDIDKLAALPFYRQRQLLHHWLGQDEPLPPAKQLIDDVIQLSQRCDHDHQTELFWQGRKQSYTIRRYRQQLYRLSSNWLKWLKLPFTEQVELTFHLNLVPEDVAATKSTLVSLRMSPDFMWQLHVTPNVLAQLSDHNSNSENGETATKQVLKIAPLDRQQRIQTRQASRPQSGKKLYQTLGIPLWLRESLVVVSVVLENEARNEKIASEPAKEIPILLLSPFESWYLSSTDLSSQLTESLLSELVNSHLSIQ